MVEEFEPDVFRQLIEYIHTGTVTLQPRTLLGEFTQPLLKAQNWSLGDRMPLHCNVWVFMPFNLNFSLQGVWWAWSKINATHGDK